MNEAKITTTTTTTTVIISTENSGDATEPGSFFILNSGNWNFKKNVLFVQIINIFSYFEYFENYMNYSNFPVVKACAYQSLVMC